MTCVSADYRVKRTTRGAHEDRNHQRYEQFSFYWKGAYKPYKKLKDLTADDESEVYMNCRVGGHEVYQIGNDFVCL